MVQLHIEDNALPLRSTEREDLVRYDPIDVSVLQLVVRFIVLQRKAADAPQ